MEKIAFLDVEGDNLLYDLTTIWCIVVYLSDKDSWIVYADTTVFALPDNAKYVSVSELTDLLKDYKVCMHNGISYDVPAMFKVLGISIPLDNCIDTMILSRLFYPDRVGHSLAWWGEGLGISKGDYNDWSALSQPMIDYCFQDVRVLIRVYNALMQESEGWDWTEAIKLEYNVQHIQTKQEMHGVLFDVPKAEELLVKLEEEIASIEEKVQKEIPMSYKDMGEIKKVFNKDGSYSKSVLTWLEGV